MQQGRTPPWTPTNPSAMVNSLHRITAAPAPPLSASLTPLVPRQHLPAPSPDHIPPYTLPHPPPAGDPLWALQAGRPPCLEIRLPLSPPHAGESSPEHPQRQGLSPLAPQMQSPPLLPPPTREPEPPSCHERPAPHPTPHPGGSSPNAYRAHARKSSPSTRASARSSSAFLPPHAAALSPRLVSRPEEGEWPARRVLSTPAASRPLLWPPKPAPPAQQEALRSGPPHA
ncbi:hypothetical protein J1605_001998 [Eschrichtius robustus]|uniref:Uncharacterized protein n=1 Tax=Eschrichtius robustus TaxID=9764 RepID=A0AB34GTK7_ESCRO|nr:hypothetical protein J1605_010466 [Eschrichtius robustus]KAJ8796927.1 hypothetical protein J1605_001998 [Eschrichtius robustus]